MEKIIDIFNIITKENPTPDLSFFTTIVTIVFSAITFVISLSIIPFQKLSESVSGYLYKILIKEKKLLISIGLTFLISFLELIGLIFIKDCILSKFLYIFGLLIVFIVLFMYSIDVLKKLDITASVFSALESHFNKIAKIMEKKEKKIKRNPLYKYNELQNIIKNSLLSQESSESYPKGNVYIDCEKIFSYKCSFIYELIQRNIDKNDYSNFEASINGLEKCLNIYFDYINNHYIIIDNFFIDFLEHSKNIISKCCKKTNNLYYEYYCILIEKIINKILSINIPKSFYQEKIIDFFFDFLYFEKKNLADCSRYIQKTFDFIRDGKTYQSVLDNFHEHFNFLIDVIYKLENPIEKSTLNYLINAFTYQVMSCKTNVYTEYVMDLIIELQEKEDAKKLLTPMLVFDDYTTDLAVGIDKKDKTLASCVIHFLLPQEELDNINDIKQRNLYRIELTLRIIKILENRYKKGGTFVNGIIVQMFVIFFNIIILLNENIFKYYTRQNWNYIFTSEEKEAYIEVLLYIIKFTANTNNNFSLDGNLLYSELKLLCVLIIENSITTTKIETFLWNHRKEIYLNILNNNKIDKKMIIEIYRFLFAISPKVFRKHFLKNIRKLKTKEKNEFYNYNSFNREQLCLQGVSFLTNNDENLQKFVNNTINEFVNKKWGRKK